MSEDSCKICPVLTKRLALNEVFIIAVRQGNHDVSDPNFHRIFAECRFPPSGSQEIDLNDIAQRLQRTQVTDSHLTGASSMTMHKRTHGRKKGGNAKKKGKKGKK